MFDNMRAKDLELMYKVFSRDESTLTPVIHAMSTYLEARGTKVVQDEAMLKEPEKYVTVSVYASIDALSTMICCFRCGFKVLHDLRDRVLL